MKTVGRGRDYQKALIANLVKHVISHKKITTTVSRGERIQQVLQKNDAGIVRMTPMRARQGDGAQMVFVEWKEHIHAKNTVNKTTGNTANVASH